ncbi:gas vesicle protein GvpJ [Natrarchaeobius chitinivorans]|uniref:Gas vesicle protein n=1 Tax=Natrarchaeobius chitinivorans TaxID=1679083 RepID=A0A3N6M5T1_NATCH|nr:gas vesicle protein [Natrarchaeobius chitinivorans]RQG95924.1 gas vesicle protein [Natrarchaeobius chitinivorans]
MVDDFQPSRQKTDLAEVVEMLLDKGIVINADIAVSIGDTQLLGVQVRAAIASFETAAKYGLEFPEGTDMRRVAEAAGEPELAEMERPNPAIDPTRGVNVTPDDRYADETREGADGDTGEGETSSGTDRGDDDSSEDGGTFEPPDRGTERLGARPDPERPTSGGFDMIGTDDGGGDGEESEDGPEGSAETDSSEEADDEGMAAETEES